MQNNPFNLFGTQGTQRVRGGHASQRKRKGLGKLTDYITVTLSSPLLEKIVDSLLMNFKFYDKIF